MASGRPRASSRETLADAACELFLEQGYEATSVGDIARRAGVSRSSFFNYFASKADILWSGLDAQIERLAERVLADDEDLEGAIVDIALEFTPDALALALVHGEAMAMQAEVEREAAVRRAAIARVVARHLQRDGATAVQAEVAGAAYAGAVLAAISAWAGGGPTRPALRDTLAEAISIASRTRTPPADA